MKTLIIHGSPKRNGDSSSLAGILQDRLSGSIIEISAYRDGIGPCIDCRYCTKNTACSIKDNMQIIYDDDFDRVVIASPVHMSSLPGPLVSIASRFQVYFAANNFLGVKIPVKTKEAALILTGGGKGRPDEALRLGKWMLKQMGGISENIQIVTSFNTDMVHAIDDMSAVKKVYELVDLWNKNEQ